MVDLSGAYDATAKAQTVVPAGTYEAAIVAAEKQAVSKNNDYGDNLTLTWEIMNGPHAKRRVWQRINLWFSGKNQETVRDIANTQFASVREATGILSPETTDELLHRPCLIKVTVKDDPGYPERNEIGSVKPFGTAPVASMGQSAPSAPSSPPPQTTSARQVFKRAASA